MLLEAIEINRRLLGEEAGLVGINLNNLAEVYREQGDWRRAEQASRESLEIKAKAFGEEHWSYAGSLTSLGPGSRR